MSSKEVEVIKKRTYDSKAYDELEFCNNAIKHFLNTVLPIWWLEKILVRLIKIFSFFPYLHQYHPGININMDIFVENRFLFNRTLIRLSINEWSSEPISLFVFVVVWQLHKKKTKEVIATRAYKIYLGIYNGIINSLGMKHQYNMDKCSKRRCWGCSEVLYYCNFHLFTKQRKNAPIVYK